MNSPEVSKSKIRKEIIEKRLNLTQEEVSLASQEICSRILELDAYKEADIVLAYMSIRNEICLDSVIEKALQDGKRVYIPKTFPDRRMEFYLYDGKFARGSFGIMEPANQEASAVFDETSLHNVLVLEPGVAYDRAGNRLGYGGGYYDTFLSKINRDKFFVVGIGYEFQIVESIPTDEHDIKPDMIITN